ncbi:MULTISPECIES: endolytic transglycosylase MltG [unclassified Roseitalea]|uniref:endolytic transglycosylase MltG n=1 Tax=unclassified Roseitalea TaxID=2639107 RepID=UPI00274016B2|nr:MULTISPECIES: endolytic transglycosylase MltG [unclassified Roseitalea]
MRQEPRFGQLDKLVAERSEPAAPEPTAPQPHAPGDQRPDASGPGTRAPAALDATTADPTPQAADPFASDVKLRPVPETSGHDLRPQGGVEPPRRGRRRRSDEAAQGGRSADNDPAGRNGPATRAQRRRARAARNPFIVFLNFVFTLAVIGVLVAAGAVYIGLDRFQEPGPLAEASTFVVPEGANLSQIASGLEERGMITDARIFRYATRAYGTESAFKAGEYEIAAGASMRDIMDVMVSGDSILHPLTIVEGTTVFQAWQRIADNPMLVGDMPPEMPPEGMLVADTQKFSRGTTREQVVAAMIDQQLDLINEVWQTRQPDLPIADMADFVTLASIVEKETGVADERPLVAGVFMNRLRRGMRLQSDPTIIYGLFGGEGMPSGRPIYQSDIRSQTPYNTYVIDGLPPGPIAIPGRASLEAVANPAETDALYFVADGTGGHAFARTLDEHNANVRRWREIRAQREAAAQETQN